MTSSARLARWVWVFSVGTAPIGCSGAGSQPSASYPGAGMVGPNIAEAGANVQQFERIFALTNARRLAPRLHPDHRRSWMRPGAAGDSLLYVSNVGNGVVYVYDYKTGVQQGGLSGLQYPYGQCVDAAGDIYITHSSALLSQNTRTAELAQSRPSRVLVSRLAAPSIQPPVILPSLPGFPRTAPAALTSAGASGSIRTLPAPQRFIPIQTFAKVTGLRGTIPAVTSS